MNIRMTTGPAVETLPLYEVTRTGLVEAQARKLAEAFGIPADGMILRDGVVSYVDGTGYLSVPTVDVDDTDVAARLRAMSATGGPDTRLRLQSIDFAALEKLSVMDDETALRKTAEAFASAGLRLEQARPVAANTKFSATFVDGTRAGTTLSHKLQTRVSYEFSDGKDHPLIGPGAQVHVTYNGAGKVVQLHHSARELKEGPVVRVFSEDEARSRVAHHFPHDAEINLWLVYWCPSLRRAPGHNQPLLPQYILPCYAYNSVVSVADPWRGMATERRTKIQLIPATDDPRFVPTVDLRASGRERVDAVVEVSGGRGPYSYVWSGSNPEASREAGPSVSYTPISRGAVPAGSARHRLVGRRETVGVTVIDANGVAIQQSAIIAVLSQLVPKGKGGGPSASYGTESPREPDFAVDRIGWQNGMATPGAGGGTEVFAWLGDLAWPGDFIEPSPPGTLPATPWINGDADYSNWGVNTAAIVLNNTDGWAQGFASSQPGATIAEYPTAELLCPSNPGDTVVTNLLNWNPTATTQDSDINYNTSWTPIGPNNQLLWLIMDACDTLDATSSAGSPQDRWGAAFGGLHILFGFNSEEQLGDGSFEQDFAEYMLLGSGGPLTILQAWFLAGQVAGVGGPPSHGIPAALGPITTGDVCDSGDFYLGKGTQGPNILPGSITGWWYVSE
jgi:Family of unknown function (DUF6345)